MTEEVSRELQSWQRVQLETAVQSCKKKHTTATKVNQMQDPL